VKQHLEHSVASWRGQSLKHRASLVDRLDPRGRILLASLWALLTVSCYSIPALTLALAGSVLLALTARVHLKRTLRRVLAMDAFIIFMLLFLPFTTVGDPWFDVMGYQASYQGVEQAVVIFLKANTTVLAVLTLVGTLEAVVFAHALARLRVPDKLVHLMLFTLRYLDVINREYKRMRMSMRARAFSPAGNRHTWRSFGYLVGMLLIRSLDRSERVLDAMKCRGFHGQLFLLDQFEFQRRDSYFAVVMLIATSTVLVVEWAL